MPPGAGLGARELARLLGGELCPPGIDPPWILGVQGLDQAGPEHLSFVSNPRYKGHVARSRAGLLLVGPGFEAGDRPHVRLEDPYAGFALAMQIFYPQEPVRAGVHPSAVVDPSAEVAGVEVRALASIGARSRVGAGTLIDAGVRVGAGVLIGRDCRILANAVVVDGSVLGDRVILNPGAVVGGEGFGFAPTAQGHVKIPQVGKAVLEDDVEIGCNSCVDRAAMDQTILRRGTKTDNLVQIGHGVDVGEHGLLVAYSGIAGSSQLGPFVTLAAKAAVMGHLRLGSGVVVGAGSIVSRDLPDGARVTGYPAFDHERWRESARVYTELGELARRVQELERQLGRALAALESDKSADKPAPS